MPRVLVVDDDRDVAVVVEDLLTDAGYEVVILDVGTDAAVQAEVERLEPDCVLLDGYSAHSYGDAWGGAAWLTARPRPVPVIMFSAHLASSREAQANTSERSQEAGFAAVLPKPFETDALLAAVATAVRRTQVPPAPQGAGLQRATLEALYDAHVRTALGYALALLRDPAAAEEVVLDALLSVWRAGLGPEQRPDVQRLLLLSVVRRGVGSALMAARPGPPAPAALSATLLGPTPQAACLREGLDRLLEGALIADLRGQFVLANAPLRAMYGTPPPPNLTIADYGRFGYRWPDGTPYAPEELPLARSLLRGEVVIGAGALLPNATSGRLEPLIISAAPLLGARHRVIGAVAVCQKAEVIAPVAWAGPPLRPPPIAPSLTTRLGTLKGEIERLADAARRPDVGP